MSCTILMLLKTRPQLYCCMLVSTMLQRRWKRSTQFPSRFFSILKRQDYLALGLAQGLSVKAYLSDVKGTEKAYNESLQFHCISRKYCAGITCQQPVLIFKYTRTLFTRKLLALLLFAM